MSAWVELIGREELRRDHDRMGIMRAAHHSDKKGYKEYAKKLSEQGS